MTKHPVPEEALKDTGAIIGRVGSGKTFTAKGLVERDLDAGRRVCIVDPTGVWWGLRASTDGKKPAYPVVVFGGVHADVAIAEASGAPLAQLLANANLPAIVDLSEFTMGGRVRFMTGFLDELYRVNKLPMKFVVDEADLFAPQRAMPDQTAMLSRMEQIVRRGRVRGFRTWLITQRPAELHKSVLSQANTLIAMQLTAPQDRDAVGAWIEGQADAAQGKRVLAELPRLKKGEGYVWSPSHDVLERVRFPAIRTFDSSRTPEEGEEPPQLELAAVDLSGITESLRKVEAEREREDPKALRAEISQLQRQLAAGVGPDLSALLDARSAGKAEGYAAAIADSAHDVVNLRRPIGAMLEEGQVVLELLDEIEKRREAWMQSRATRAAPNPATPPAAATMAALTRPALTGDAGGAVGMPKAERRILAALAQYPSGRTKNQVAILAGYAINGGGFNNALSSARGRGWITRGEPMAITSEGLLALGSYEPLPRGHALLQHWYGQLDKAPRKLLEALAEVYPKTLTKAQVANRAGYEPEGGGFNNALSRLRTLELIHGARGGELKASDDFFQ